MLAQEIAGKVFLSTLSLRRATAARFSADGSVDISIHALLAESDFAGCCDRAAGSQISIHALLAESDAIVQVRDNDADSISIHALLAESDMRSWAPALPRHRFLSTLSLRRATPHRCRRVSQIPISIHALLAESDLRSGRCRGRPGHFYPRSPCGERLSGSRLQQLRRRGFLSTLSLRRATPATPAGLKPLQQFLSTLSLRRATITGPKDYRRQFAFLSTLSLRRATPTSKTLKTRPSNFYPRSPCGERRMATLSAISTSSNFYPRSPCGERRCHRGRV